MSEERLNGKLDAIISVFKSGAGLHWDDLGEDQQREVRAMLVPILLCDFVVKKEDAGVPDEPKWPEDNRPETWRLGYCD